MASPRSRRLLLAAGLGGAAATAVVLQRRRHATQLAALPPLDHDPLAPLSGDERELVMDDGATISITDAGSGEAGTALVVHGWVNDRRVWSDVQPRLLDAGFRVVAYDQRGHGRSTLGSDRCTIARLGADMATVLEALDLHDVVVAGHSMGGMAAQSMLIDQRHAHERVKAVVLVSTGAAGIGMPPWLRAIGEAVVGWEGGDRFLRGRGGLAQVRGAFGRHPRPEHLEACRQMLLQTPPAARRAFVEAMHEMDLRTGLRDIPAATSVIVGTADTLTPPARARLIASSIPGATLEVLPGRGHMLTWEAPDEVAHLIEVAAK